MASPGLSAAGAAAGSRREGRHRAHRAAVWALAAAASAAVPAAAQPGGFAMPVGVVEAVNHELRRTVELTGSVESRRHSLVASEVSGLVVELAARDGDRVRRGQALVKLRRETAQLRLEAAEGQLREARALLRLAETNRERAEELFEEQVFSRQQLDDALSQYDATQGRVSQLEADVARLQDDLARTIVRAPFDAVVVEEHAAVGEWIGAGDPVAELVDTDNLEVTVDVPEQFFAGLQAGAKVRLEVVAAGRSDLEGTVRAVVPRANRQARTFPVKVVISNPEGAIGVGMLAKVHLPIGRAEPAVLVPKDAIVAQGPARLLFLVDEEGKAQPVPVTLGNAAGDWIAVRGEIEAGDRVIVQGNERLQPGQPVAAREVELERP